MPNLLEKLAQHFLRTAIIVESTQDAMLDGGWSVRVGALENGRGVITCDLDSADPSDLFAGEHFSLLWALENVEGAPEGDLSGFGSDVQGIVLRVNPESEATVRLVQDKGVVAAHDLSDLGSVRIFVARK